MFFESTKGKSVFGIYSTDDDTLLYASRGEDAVREHQFVTLAREEYSNGRLTDTSAEGLRAWGEAVRVQLDAISDNAGDAVASGRPGGDAEVYGEQPRLYASAALRNVLENIFKTEEPRRANSVTEQPTQASEESKNTAPQDHL